MNKKEKYTKINESQKETKKLQEISQDAINHKNKEIQEKETQENKEKPNQDPQIKMKPQITTKRKKQSKYKKTRTKKTPEEKRKKWLTKDKSNSKKNIPWNKEYKEKEKKKIELQAKLQAETQDKEIQELQKKIEDIEAIHKSRTEYFEKMKIKYTNIKNVTQFEEASTLIDLLYYEKNLFTFTKVIMQINQFFVTAEEKKKKHMNTYHDIKNLERIITQGNRSYGTTFSKEVIQAIPEEAKAKWLQRLKKLKEC